MTAAKRVEYQITRKLLQSRQQGAAQQPQLRADVSPWADRLIGIAAATAGLFILGSYLEELLWVAVAATTVFTLR